MPLAAVERIEPPEELSRQATKVLQEAMMFHDKKAKYIITQIIKLLKEGRSLTRGRGLKLSDNSLSNLSYKVAHSHAGVD